MGSKTRATIDDLYQVEGKAELVHGEIVRMPPTGKASDPEHPVIFRCGDIADAEPAVPGWRIAVHDLFE